MSSTAPMVPGREASANEQFKAKYPQYLKRALLLSVLFLILFFSLTPQYVPNPYRLRQRTFEVVDIPDAIELPPPPEEAPRPQVPVEAVPDDEVTEEIDIAESLFDDFSEVLSTPIGTGDDDGAVFVASQEKPKLTRFVPPDYPEMARASQLEGTVIVKVLVGPDGNVMDAQVIQSVHPMLDRAAVEAARKCKFTPGKQRNIPVKAWMAIPFRFRLH